MIPRVLLLALVAVTMIQSDPTYFRVVMSCHPSIRNYCGTFSIYEENVVVNTLVKVDNFCTNEKIRDVQYPGMNLNGDFSEHYEIGYRVSHNCTIDGSVRCLRHEQILRVPTISPQRVNINMDLFNKGEDGKCKHKSRD